MPLAHLRRVEPRYRKVVARRTAHPWLQRGFASAAPGRQAGACRQTGAGASAWPIPACPSSCQALPAAYILRSCSATRPPRCGSSQTASLCSLQEGTGVSVWVDSGGCKGASCSVPAMGGHPTARLPGSPASLPRPSTCMSQLLGCLQAGDACPDHSKLRACWDRHAGGGAVMVGSRAGGPWRANTPIACSRSIAL